MKPLQYYKKQIFIMGCLGMFPMLVFAQETLSSANGLHGDYSGSRVERSADGDKLDIEFSIGLVEKLKSQQMMYISPRFVSVDGKKAWNWNLYAFPAEGGIRLLNVARPCIM